MELLVRTDRVKAHLLRDALAHAGIRAHVLNTHVQGAIGELPPEAALPQVWLQDGRDRDRACAVLAALESDAKRSSETRWCPACGESSPGSFDVCWACGAAL
ncbi:MAG: DUF2007 domain-containing protein [Burkholderiales bacterium]